MFERFTRDARRIVTRAAEEETRALAADTVEAEHLLLALAAEEESPVGRLLAAHGLDHDGVIEALERETERSLAAVGVGAGDFARPAPAGPHRRRKPRFAASAKRVLERATLAALGRGDRAILAPHLLLGILRADVGTVPRALAAAGVDRFDLAAEAERLLG